MIRASAVIWKLAVFVSSAGSCDLPLGKIPQLTLPNERSSKDTWATAFGVSPQEWTSISATPHAAYELRSLLEKGYTDWAGMLLAETTSLDRKLRKRLPSIKALTAAVKTSSSIGEVFGNHLLVEASAAYYLLGFGSEPGTLYEDLEMLWKLQNRFGVFDQSSKQTRACIQRLHRMMLEPKDFKAGSICRCEQLWACSDDRGLIRVTLSRPQRYVEDLNHTLDSGVALQGVRILEFRSGKLFRKGILKQLLDLFPKVKVMRVLMHEEPVDVEPLRLWIQTGSILGLSLEISSTHLPDWICEFRSLRYLGISGHKRSGEHISIKALPACLGNLSELIHLNVVGCNLTGQASLPNSLGNLQKLRIFEAFENGRLGSDQNVDCPWDSLPNRSLCVPGYVAQDEGSAPVWRCPVHGWNIHFDDMTLPWWRWKSIEKMHIDANFIYGGIPETLPELWPKLRSLDLHDLQLTGPLPRSLENLVNLTQLQVQMNHLTCHPDFDVVARLMKHPKLRTFNIDANPELCGCLPSKALPHLSVRFGGSSVQLCENFEEL